MPDVYALDMDRHRSIVILTGAGVSAASGLPTYRGPGGLWEKAEIARLVEARNLPGSLPGLWGLYRERRATALRVPPNAAHMALAAFQDRWSDTHAVTLVTQNVDGLHQRAGSADVLELHGSAYRTRCLDPSCSLAPFHDERIYDDVAICPVCGGPLRPDVVLFGETLSPEVLERAYNAVAECDLFLAVGTSGVVAPAAGFVHIAALVEARTILVNLEPMDPPNPAFREEYLGRAEEILPVLLGQTM